MSRTIFTIGHSTRTIADFVALLQQVDVDLLVDVRSIPGSRATPQFNIETLPDSLAAEGIGYEHLRSLGGRRHHKKGAPPSTNTFWRVLAFRNYADYAETDAFRAGLDELLALAREHSCAIMCAEAVWWRCHRASSPILCWPAAFRWSTSWDLAKSRWRPSHRARACWRTGRCAIRRLTRARRL